MILLPYLSSPEIIDFFDYTNKEIIALNEASRFLDDYNTKYKNSSCSWRNRDILERNIAIYVKNKKSVKSKIEN